MSKSLWTALAVAAFLTVALRAQQQGPAPRGANPQQQPPGTASISGSVVAMGANTPIAGAVVEIRRSECSSFSNPPDVQTARADANGKFTFQNLRAGGWCVVATVTGGAYMPAEYMQRDPRGRGVTIPLFDGQHVTNIDLALAPTGGISGRVLDQDGEPMARARVEVLEPFYDEGRRKLYILQSVQTNDLGGYRFFWLPPGRYFLAVTAEDARGRNTTAVLPQPGAGGRREATVSPVVTRRIDANGVAIEETFVTVYYPGDTNPDHAAPVEVGIGATVGGIDFLLVQAKKPSFHVRGNLINSITGEPATGAQVRIVPREWSATVVMPSGVTDGKGDFDIAGVVPGFYVLYASAAYRPPDEGERGGAAPRGGGPAPAARGARGAAPAAGADPAARGAAPPAVIQLGARAPLSIGYADAENLRLTLTVGVDIPGKARIERADGDIPRGLNVSLARDPDIVGSPTLQGRGGAVQPDGSFTLNAVGPGDYRVLVAPFITGFQWAPPAPPRGLENVYVKSVRFDGRDVLDEGLHLTSTAISGPIEIVLATGGTVTGAVFNEKRENLANVTVALVPDLPYRKRTDLFRSTATDRYGRFRLQGIPPGAYKAFAWQTVERDLWLVPEFLQVFETRGIAVSVREEGESSVELDAITP